MIVALGYGWRKGYEKVTNCFMECSIQKEPILKATRIVRNVITNIILQVVLMISGLLIPRFLLMYYGSTVNGMISSIAQFITYVALVEMGIENAAVVALYRPIADKNNEELESILVSAKRMYRQSGTIYFVLVIVLAFCYPLMIREQLEYTFVFQMVLCVGAVNVIDFFILGKYKVFLIAEQKYYILNIARILATIVLLVVSVILLQKQSSVLAVKSCAIVTHLGEALFIFIYMRCNYRYIKYQSPRLFKIKQRLNAFIHQICAVIVYNTDLVVLTVFLSGQSLMEISVYTVYALAFSFLSNFVSTLTTGIQASFGNLYACNEKQRIRTFFGLYEFLYLMFCCFMCACFSVLIIPFVSCYTKGITDVKYIRYEVGILFALCGLSAQIKDASAVIIKAVGRYKETQRYAIEEAVVKVLVSLMLVRPLGIVGVLIGTLVSHIIMSFHFIYYVAKELIPSSGRDTLIRIVRNCLLVGTIMVVELQVVQLTDSWVEWIVRAFIITIVNSAIFLGINCYFEPEQGKQMMMIMIQRIKKLMVGRNGGS